MINNKFKLNEHSLGETKVNYIRKSHINNIHQYTCTRTKEKKTHLF